MVVKTDLCSFSEYRVYPGNGMKFVRRDGQPLTLGTSKAKCMVNQRKKPAKLRWTQAWRRKHRKGKTEETARRRTRRAVKAQRAIVGASLEDIKKRVNRPRRTEEQRQAALKAVKERREQRKEAKKEARTKARGGPAAGAGAAAYRAPSMPKARGAGLR
eukprot:CAMPEP_0198439678 /NCGR_PEP_ID=MMETSP1452-20131203/55861_1 /TAXON_ID=1181717 /ORGANISM="Synchroma pusillum, Strain CCMP3072" /LENGTH=158 /DNA_ID=CAMNT_0044160289 /DNA_START=28 /DNA_END=504 /DNA_ORIENTATION=+